MTKQRTLLIYVIVFIATWMNFWLGCLVSALIIYAEWSRRYRKGEEL